MRALALAGLALGAIALGCAPPAQAPSAGASPFSGGGAWFRPGEATPIPEGVVGTPDPFLAAHPPTSVLSAATRAEPSPEPVPATYVVAGARPAPGGGFQLYALARGVTAPKGEILEARFEVPVQQLPAAPASFPVVAPPAAPGLGQAAVSVFRGGGASWTARSGSVAITRIDRRADAVAFEFSVSALLEPATAGMVGTPQQTEAPTRPAGSPSPGGSPAPGGPTASPTATPTPTAVPTASPTAPPPAPYVLLQEARDTLSLRWTGTFFLRPGEAPAP